MTIQVLIEYLLTLLLPPNTLPTGNENVRLFKPLCGETVKFQSIAVPI